MTERAVSPLTESQQRRLVTTCHYLDQMLTELEHSMQEAKRDSPFKRYIADLTPADETLFRDYASRLRGQLVRILNSDGLDPRPTPISLRHSLLTSLTSFDIAVSELEPRYMRGYGELVPSAAAMLNGIVEELRGTVRQLKAYLASEPLRDTKRRGDQSAPELEIMKRIIGKYGLIEFRESLAAISETMTRAGLELAVFGRVNSGKSSLLNRLIGSDVLPIGVTPVTAVPTRIRFGEKPRLLVTSAGVQTVERDASRLVEYASEELNPANRKRILRLVVELPSPLLASGVTLVDTPGFGSLANAGAVETLAYLPYCDVGMILVDASATIAIEDVKTVAALLQAGAHVWMLLSKADLLSDADRIAALRYISETLAREFQNSIQVIPISTVPERQSLFEQWHRDHLLPMIERQESERRQAVARKRDLLQARIGSALRSLVKEGFTPEQQEESRDATALLQQAGGLLAEHERQLLERIQVLSTAVAQVFNAARRRVKAGQNPHQALAAAFGEVADRTSADITGALERLAGHLWEIRQRVARSVSWRQGEPGWVALRGPREVPAPEFSASNFIASTVELPEHANWLARTLASQRLRRRAAREVAAALRNYSSVLRDGTLELLRQLRQDWSSDSDALRAELDRRLGYAPSSPVKRVEIVADLRLLDRTQIYQDSEDAS